MSRRIAHIDTTHFKRACAGLFDNRVSCEEGWTLEVLEFCNLLILNDELAYDGHVSQKNRNDIDRNLGMADGKTEELVRALVIPYFPPFEKERNGARLSFAASVSSYVEHGPPELTGRQNRPMTDPSRYFIKPIKSRQTLSESRLRDMWIDTNKTGHRFYAIAQDSDQSCEEARRQLRSVDLTPKSVEHLFSWFRYHMSDNRAACHQGSEPDDVKQANYFPVADRARMAKQLFNHTKCRFSAFQHELMPRLEALAKREGLNLWLNSHEKLFPPAILLAVGEEFTSRTEFFQKILEFRESQQANRIRTILDEYEDRQIEERHEILREVEEIIEAGGAWSLAAKRTSELVRDTLITALFSTGVALNSGKPVERAMTEGACGAVLNLVQEIVKFSPTRVLSGTVIQQALLPEERSNRAQHILDLFS